MNGSLKKSVRTLYGVCTCIIVLMVICYFGVSNSKGTYSATSVNNCFANFVGTSGTKTLACIDRSTCGNYVVAPSSGGSKNNASFLGWYSGTDCTGSFASAGFNLTVNNCYTNITSVTYYACFKCDDTGEYVGYNEECSSDSSGACYIAKHKYLWAPTHPGSSYTEVSGISHGDCTGCESGYSENDKGDCVASSDNNREYACYNRNDTDGTRVWTNAPSSTWTKNNITSPDSCKDCYKCIVDEKVSYYMGTISNDNCFFYSHNNCPSSGTPAPTPPDSQPPTSKPSSTPGSFSSSKPSSISTTLSSSSSNVDDNPKTGSVAIFMVWVIALGTLIYSFVYFKQSKFE